MERILYIYYLCIQKTTRDALFEVLRQTKYSGKRSGRTKRCKYFKLFNSNTMVQMTITAENFAALRENLKNGEPIQVNNQIILIGYEPNIERINPNGKKTRTPFYYLSEGGKKYTSTTLKEALGIEPETKGKREETTFAKVWEQAKGLAKEAMSKELKEAAKYLTDLAKEAEKREEAEKQAQAAQALADLKASGLSNAAIKKLLGL